MGRTGTGRSREDFDLVFDLRKQLARAGQMRTIKHPASPADRSRARIVFEKGNDLARLGDLFLARRESFVDEC